MGIFEKDHTSTAQLHLLVALISFWFFDLWRKLDKHFSCYLCLHACLDFKHLCNISLDTFSISIFCLVSHGYLLSSQWLLTLLCFVGIMWQDLLTGKLHGSLLWIESSSCPMSDQQLHLLWKGVAAARANPWATVVEFLGEGKLLHGSIWEKTVRNVTEAAQQTPRSVQKQGRRFSLKQNRSFPKAYGESIFMIIFWQRTFFFLWLCW